MSHRPFRAYPSSGWIVFLGFCALWLGFSYDRGFNLGDEGNAIYPALRILNGELPHRDFLTLYTGGIYYLYALLFAVFGVHAGVVRVATALVVGLIALMTVHLSARFMKGIWAFLPAVVFVAAFPLNPTAYHSWYAVAGGLLALLALHRYLDTGALRWLVTAGLCAGAGFLAKQTMGAFAFSALAGFLLLCFPVWPRGRPFLDRLARALLLGLAAFFYTQYLGQSSSIRPHEQWVYLTPLWFLPLAVLSGLMPAGRPAEAAPDPVYPSALRALGAGVAGFLLLPALYTLYFAGQGSLGALLYGVLQRPGLFVDDWVSSNQFPPLLPWICNPLATFLLLLIWPAWPLARRWRNPWLRRLVWPVLCLALLMYPVRLIGDGWRAAGSAFSFLSWANYEIFFSIVYYAPVFAPWLAVLWLVLERAFPGSTGLSPFQGRHLAAVYALHIFLFFCVYPMQHAFYLVYMLPTTLVMITAAAHQLWRLTTPSAWLQSPPLSRAYHLARLGSLLALPLTALAAFFIWGTQYWIGLRHLGQEGRMVWDDRVTLPLPRASWGFALKPDEAKPLAAVCAYLQRHTRPDEPVFVLAPHGPLVLFLAERFTPARVDFPVLHPTEAAAIVEGLARNPPRYMVFESPWEETEGMDALLAAQYRPEAEVEGYLLFRHHPYP